MITKKSRRRKKNEEDGKGEVKDYKKRWERKRRKGKIREMKTDEKIDLKEEKMEKGKQGRRKN